jgi:hypothetical protein
MGAIILDFGLPLMVELWLAGCTLLNGVLM